MKKELNFLNRNEPTFCSARKKWQCTVVATNRHPMPVIAIFYDESAFGAAMLANIFLKVLNVGMGPDTSADTLFNLIGNKIAPIFSQRMEGGANG